MPWRTDRYQHIPMVRDALERDRRTVVINDVQSNPRFDVPGTKRAGVECQVVLPLIMGDEFVAAMVVARIHLLPSRTDEVSDPRGRGPARHDCGR